MKKLIGILLLFGCCLVMTAWDFERGTTSNNAIVKEADGISTFEKSRQLIIYKMSIQERTNYEAGKSVKVPIDRFSEKERKIISKIMQKSVNSECDCTSPEPENPDDPNSRCCRICGNYLWYVIQCADCCYCPMPPSPC